MAHLSQTDSIPNPRQILEAQLRELFGRAVYSHKTQEKCADILLQRQSCIKWFQIGFLALLTCVSAIRLLNDWPALAILAAVVSAILLAVNLYTKSHDLGEVAQRHRQAAIDTWLIREKYLSLITDLRIGDKPIDVLQRERDSLLQDLYSVYSGSPSSWSRAYRKAQKALKRDEEMTFSDDEIDAFLPDSLRKAIQCHSKQNVIVRGTGPKQRPPKADHSGKPPGGKPRSAPNPPQQLE